jgi:hypothetical protein
MSQNSQLAGAHENMFESGTFGIFVLMAIPISVLLVIAILAL